MQNASIAIITGSSRGLGAALAAECLERGIPVIAVARNTNRSLTEHARSREVALQQIEADLSDPAAAEQLAHAVAATLPENLERCLLINNAGTVQPVAGTENLTDAMAITAALTLNVTSIMLLTAAVLQACTARSVADCRVLNISSGAGRSPTAGWGVYCASKAAVDHYTRVLALEHPTLRAVSLAPGVIDTSMQAAIRDSSPHDFPQRDRFVALHEQGNLSAPETTARHILQFLHRDDFGTKVLDDIRSYS